MELSLVGVIQSQTVQEGPGAQCEGDLHPADGVHMGRQTLCPHHPSYPALSIFRTAETLKQVAWSNVKTRVHLEAIFVLRLGPLVFLLQKIHLGSPAPKPQPLLTGISGSLVSLLSTAPGLQSCRPALPSPGGRKPPSVPHECKSLPSRWDSGQEPGVYRQPPAITEQVTRVSATWG